MTPKILLVGFDGLRPDLITAKNMPNLAAFAAQGSSFANHRSVFPSETRVNLTSLSTGSWPESHGIVANKYIDRRLPEFGVFDTSRVDHIERGEAVYGGKLIEAVSLGEALDAAGRSLAVIATGSQGSSRLKSHKTGHSPHLSIACAAPETSRPYAITQRIIQSAGTPPAGRVPATDVTRYATDLFLDHVYPELEPDVTMLWYVEPDTSFHYAGLAKSTDVLASVDRQFGRLVDWAHDHPEVQIIAMSDHGHVAQEWPMDVRVAFQGLGLNIANQIDNAADAIVLPGHVTRVWVNRNKDLLLPAISQVLMEAPWCGPIFAKEPELVPGALAQSLARTRHPRSPDLYCVRHADSGIGSTGLPGRAFFLGDDGLPPGAGNHGGLQREEISSFAAMGGTLFRSQFRSETPSGIVDIAPTILRLLNVPQPATMTGRPLDEALIGQNPQQKAVLSDVIEASYKGYRQVLRRWSVGERFYLDHAERVKRDRPISDYRREEIVAQ